MHEVSCHQRPSATSELPPAKMESSLSCQARGLMRKKRKPRHVDGVLAEWNVGSPNGIQLNCVVNVLYPGTKQCNAYAASYVLLTRAQFCLRGINRLTQTLRWTFLVPGHSPSLRAATFTCRNRSVSRQHRAVEDDDVDEEDEADEAAATEEARR